MPQARPPWGPVSAALVVVAALGAGGHTLWADRLAAPGASPAGAGQPDLGNADTLAQQARSLASQSQFAAALPVFRQALARHPGDASLLADTAETLFNLNGQTLDGEPAALVALALAHDPANLKALVLAANAATAQHDMTAAAALWTRALAAVPANQPDLKGQLQARLDEAQRGLAAAQATVIAAAAAATANATTSAATAAAPARSGAAAVGTAAAPPAPPEASTRSGTGPISGIVSIAPEVSSNLQPTDLVLITVSTEGGSTPLATLRQRVKDLPYRFSVPVDAGSAAPGSAPRLIVQARVSRAEHATPQAGDWLSTPTATAPGSSGVRVMVSEPVR